MKKILTLLVAFVLVITLSACTVSSNQLMYVTEETYDSAIDVTTVTVYYLAKDESYDGKIIGTDYETNDAGYVCVEFANNKMVFTNDHVTILNLNDCDEEE